MRWFRTIAKRLAPVLLAFLCCQALLAADAAGQADLDAATSLKLSASSMADLERVIELTESAIEKGLDPENEDLAKSLITATLFQHGSRFAQALFDPRERTDSPAMLKQFALKDLYAILKYDESLPQVYMMIARLEGVNVGEQDRREGVQRGRDAADKAIELLEDDKPAQSKALVLRAGYETSDSSKRIEFLDRATEVDPENADAWRLRGKSRLVKGEMYSAQGNLEAAKTIREEAVADFMKLLEMNPNDPDALQTGAELLGRLGQFEKAMEFVNQAIEQNPGVFSVHLLRARLHHKQGNYDAAIADLNQALDIKPGNFLAYLDRAEVYYDSGDKKSAAKDYGKTRELQGNKLPAVIIQRMMIRSENNVEKGIAEIERFMELDELNAAEEGRDPDPDYRLQLAATYTDQTKPLEAIEVLSPLIDTKEDRSYSDATRARNAHFLALRTRANSYLSIGKHEEAIVDYKKAQEIIPNDPGVLNNLAWVLATSPKDDIRNAKEAIEFATEACEVTEYKAAHILSTLAAAYADSGDFDMAKKYSQQAVDLAEQAEGEARDEEMIKQLKKERESYGKKEPWREIQNVVEEKAKADAENAAADTSADVDESDEATEDVVEEEPAEAAAN